MAEHPDPDRQKEPSLLLGVLTLFLFASPLTYWWASGFNPWYFPYLLWLLIILLGLWLRIRPRRHDL